MDRRVALVLAIPLVLYVAWAGLGRSPREGQGAAPLPDETVLVIVVKRPGDLAAVREVIEPERIVANSLDGFAVREGRVVVTSVEAAGPLLSLAGWAEAGLEIVHVEARATPRAADSPGGADLGGLYGKATLTLPEAIRALELLR